MDMILEELRAGAHAVWNRKWIAMAVAWGVCLLGWLAIAFIPNAYESNARIFVQLDDALAQQIGIGSGSRAKDIDRVRQTLTSAVNLEKVIRATRLGEDVANQRQMEIAIEDLTDDIQVSSEQENLFRITAEIGNSSYSDAENAALAQDIVQRMIDIFREENLAGGRGEMRETIEFLDQQLADRQKELEAAEQRRLAFEAQNPELIGGASTIASRLTAARSELRSVDADLAAAQSALAATEGQLAGTPRSLQVPGQVNGAVAALAQAKAQMTALRSRGLTDSHPDVVALNKQIAALEDQARASGGGGSSMPNPAYSSLESIRGERLANVQALQARRAALSAEMAQIMADQANEPGAAAEATRISRDYDVLREQYDKLLKDREELRLRGQVENERSAIKFEVIDPPTTPRVPSAPNRPLLLLGVFIVAIGAGGAVAYGLSKINSSFATAGALERAMDLPVIGTISKTATDASRALARKRLRQFGMASGALAGLFVVLMAVEFIQRGMVA
jgi:polysaccharide chain length determinant protein (PEP-CTERM system associated)